MLLKQTFSTLYLVNDLMICNLSFRSCFELKMLLKLMNLFKFLFYTDFTKYVSNSFAFVLRLQIYNVHIYFQNLQLYYLKTSVLKKNF